MPPLDFVTWGERLLEALEVAPDLGLHVGVEHRQRRALVLARLRPDVGREAHGQPGGGLLGDRLRLPLVRGVAVRVQERYDESLDALSGQPLRTVMHGAFVERRVDPAVGPEALAHLGDSRPGHQRQRSSPVEIERVRQPQALQLEDVAEPFGDEQAQPGAGALDQRVHRDRRAVHDGADLAEVDAVLVGQTLKADPDGLGELVRGRGDLQADDLAGLRVEQGEVGERPADVDAEPVARHARSSTAAAGRSQSHGRAISIARDRLARIGYDPAPRE